MNEEFNKAWQNFKDTIDKELTRIYDSISFKRKLKIFIAIWVISASLLMINHVLDGHHFEDMTPSECKFIIENSK